MNIGGGEAADQMVRMMLSGSEVAIRLTGSAAKNLLAMSLALAKSHKKISGKVRMGRMLQQTRDLRVFPMTQEEYRAFQKGAGTFHLTQKGTAQKLMSTPKPGRSSRMNRSFSRRKPPVMPVSESW